MAKIICMLMTYLSSERSSGNSITLDSGSQMSMRQSRSALLWSVLSPILYMPISDSKRQTVLGTACVLYSVEWHAISRDRRPLRKQYIESILQPFVAVLLRWRPLLAGIHELVIVDGMNPTVVDDRALAADPLPIEGALSMITPEWAAAFALPPAAMALAMIAAGAAGWEVPPPPTPSHLRLDSSMLQRKTAKFQTFASFQKPLELPHNNAPPQPRDKAAAKAAALAAARDLERNAKFDSGRGLSAVAMATSAQRRNIGDMSYKFIHVLIASFVLVRNMQRSEIDRHMQRSDSNLRPSNDLEEVRDSSEVSPGFIPSELDERVHLEIPTSMVRSIRVVKGTFQVCLTNMNVLDFQQVANMKRENILDNSNNVD